MSEEKVISIEPQDEALLAVVECERMEEVHNQKLQDELFSAAERARQLPVILDLSKVMFMPSLSLGVLVNLHREFKQHNQRLILVGLQPDVRSTLAITRLDKLFEICESVNDALTLVRRAS